MATMDEIAQALLKEAQAQDQHRPAETTALTVQPHDVTRNTPMPLDLNWVQSIQVNEAAIAKRCATYHNRRNADKEWQAAWLLKAIQCIDLTTLAGDDTVGRVRRLCAKARQPVRPDLLAALGVDDRPLTTGAVCVRLP